MPTKTGDNSKTELFISGMQNAEEWRNKKINVGINVIVVLFCRKIMKE
jgi:hypothetical protein